MEEKVILKKDIVIPAGTVLSKAPTLTRRVGEGHYMADIEMNPDSTAFFSLDITDCKEYFE